MTPETCSSRHSDSYIIDPMHFRYIKLIARLIMGSMVLIWMLLPSISIASETLSYDTSTDTLKVKVQDVYLDELLTKLSKTVGFEVQTQGINHLHRLVSLDMHGNSKLLITRLVKPNSVVISQSDKPPYKVTRVILLPEGTSDSQYLPKQSIAGPRPPKYRGDPRHDEKAEQHYLKSLRKHAERKPGQGSKPPPVKVMKRSIKPTKNTNEKQP